MTLDNNCGYPEDPRKEKGDAVTDSLLSDQRRLAAMALQSSTVCPLISCLLHRQNLAIDHQHTYSHVKEYNENPNQQKCPKVNTCILAALTAVPKGAEGGIFRNVAKKSDPIGRIVELQGQTSNSGAPSKENGYGVQEWFCSSCYSAIGEIEHNIKNVDRRE